MDIFSQCICAYYCGGIVVVWYGGVVVCFCGVVVRSCGGVLCKCTTLLLRACACVVHTYKYTPVVRAETPPPQNAPFGGAFAHYFCPCVPRLPLLMKNFSTCKCL